MSMRTVKGMKANSSDLIASAFASATSVRPELRERIEKIQQAFSSDSRGPHAISAMTEDVTTAAKIIACCAEAVALCERFHKIVSAEDAIPSRMNDLKEATSKLDRFICEIAAGPDSPLEARIRLSPDEADNLRIALSTIGILIDGRHRVAEQTKIRLARTRNWATEDAGENAALAWLGDGVRSITGGPNRPHVATLGGIVLRIKPEEATVDRVREASRKRQKIAAEIDWRSI